jgi:hypothetical protein
MVCPYFHLYTRQCKNLNSGFTGTPVGELAERGETNIRVLNAEEIVAMRKVCKVVLEPDNRSA